MRGIRPVSVALMGLVLVTACSRGSVATAEAVVPGHEGSADTVVVAQLEGSVAPVVSAESEGSAIAVPVVEGSGADGAAENEAAAAIPGSLGPLPDEVRARFEAMRADPDPEALVRNSHYWVSNENSHFLWHDVLDGVGGTLMGVGTDQLYLFAGWARSELVVPLDFDQEIVNLHWAYAVVFEMAATPTEFVELWSDESASAVEARLREVYTDEAQQRAVVRAYDIAHSHVRSRLRRVIRIHEEIPTFLTDQEQYDHVRGLWADGRVFPIRGDLTADQSMLDLGDALRASGLDMRVLYLSNAEQYFDYTPSFRRNIVELPSSESSIVLRTLGWELHGFVEGEEYHYNTMSLPLFQQWMRESRVERAGRILRYKEETDIAGYSVIVEAPEPDDDGRVPTIAPRPGSEAIAE